MLNARNERRIVLLVCHLGPLPRYFVLFIASCATVNGVDFIIFTDQDDTISLPENVRWFNIGRKEISELASSVAGTNVDLGNGYKLCDFKPAYGHMFQEYISNYALWGYTDTDVVFGDLHGMISKYWKNETDILSCKGAHWMSGALSLYRNNSDLRHLYQSANGVNDSLSRSEYVGFDECYGRWGDQADLRDGCFTHEYESISDVVGRFSKSGQISYVNQEIISEHKSGYLGGRRRATISYDFGRMFDALKNEDIALYHMIFTKNDPFFYVPEWSIIPQSFAITSSGFVDPHLPVPRAIHREIERLARGCTVSVDNFRKKIIRKLLL